LRRLPCNPRAVAGAFSSGLLDCARSQTEFSKSLATPLRRRRPTTVLAGATGLEPATSGVTGRRSNQLNYAPEATVFGGAALNDRSIRCQGKRAEKPRLFSA
jgi:hypothetical protein